MISDSKPLSLFLCGDVMTGRGIDQALPHPGDSKLYEDYVRDARTYVELAEKANGPIPRPVSFKYIWGDVLSEPEWGRTEARIINLETSITSDGEPWPEKGIHYRMHPHNASCLAAARITACSLANNHVLDWGYAGLVQTLETLERMGIAHAGAGRNQTEAAAPAIIEINGKARVLLFSFGSNTSGVPNSWRADMNTPGVNVINENSQKAAERIVAQVRQFQKTGDLIIASIHWGGNWGYEVPGEQRALAHRLIDEGVALVCGHSSHHVKPLEIYKEHLVLYGAGDFLNDYEGIVGYEGFRGDLALMYFIKLDPSDGRMTSAWLVPMQMRQFRLNHASAADTKWLGSLLDQLCAPFGTRVEPAEDNSLKLRW